MKRDQDRDRAAKRARTAALMCAALLGLGCATDTEDEAMPGNRPAGLGVSAQGAAGGASLAEDAPSFGEVYAIFEATCGGGQSGCHVTGTSAQLALPDEAAAYDALVGVASRKCEGEMLVAPGDADASVLVQTLEGTSACIKAMPLGRDPLRADQVAIVRAWIDADAPHE